MLAKIFGRLLLAILVLIALVYAFIPMWAKYALDASSIGQDWRIQQLKIGYPLPNGWQVHDLNAVHRSTTTQLHIHKAQLTYDWQQLRQGKLSSIDIETLTLIESSPDSLDQAIPSLFAPSTWLRNLPDSFRIDNFAIKVSNAVGLTLPSIATNDQASAVRLESFSLHGNVTAASGVANIAAKLSTRDGATNALGLSDTVYLDVSLSNDNQTVVKVFTETSETPIAKLSSTTRARGTSQGMETVWQGQLVANIAEFPHLLNKHLPANFTLESGQVSSHWRLHIPNQVTSEIQASTPMRNPTLAQLLQLGYGEHQIRLNGSGLTPWRTSILLDANVTQTIISDSPSQWMLNAGSQLLFQPSAPQPEQTDASGGLLDAWHESLRVRLDATSNLQLVLDDTSGDLSLDGTINGEFSQIDSHLLNDANLPPLQGFLQLRDLVWLANGRVSGATKLSGHIPLPKDRGFMQASLLPLHDLQALAEARFLVDSDVWQVTIAKASSISANQVVAKTKQDQIRLFASDRLNLTTDTPITFTYYTQHNDWAWSDIAVSLTPQSTAAFEGTSTQQLGITATLPAGNTRSHHRPQFGQFTINANHSTLQGWPPFNLIGEGYFQLDNYALEASITASALPYAPSLEGHFQWQIKPQKGNASLSINTINVARLWNQLDKQATTLNHVQSNNHNDINIHDGSANYYGTWHWDTSSNAKHVGIAGAIDPATRITHTIDLNKVTLSHNDIISRGLAGKLLFSDTGAAHRANLTIPTLSRQQHHKAPAITNVSLKAEYPSDRGMLEALSDINFWHLHSMSGDFLGGTVRRVNANNHIWYGHNLNADDVLGLLNENITATGSLNGEVEFAHDGKLQRLDLRNANPLTLRIISSMNEPASALILPLQTGILQSGANITHMHVHGQISSATSFPITINLKGHPLSAPSIPIDLTFTVASGELLLPKH